MNWDEMKTKRTIMLTETAWENLEAMVLKLGLPSKSELVESIARGVIPIEDKGITAGDKESLGKPLASS